MSMAVMLARLFAPQPNQQEGTGNVPTPEGQALQAFDAMGAAVYLDTAYRYPLGDVPQGPLSFDQSTALIIHPTRFYYHGYYPAAEQPDVPYIDPWKVRDGRY